MRILFTGASSFTGYWFVRALADAGHEVVAIFSQAEPGYSGVRGERGAALADHCERRFECRFGDPAFLELIRGGGPWDALCHHAADVTDYKSPDFDYAAALASNTRELPAVLEALTSQGCGRVALTGSVFEGGEGAGSGDLGAFSPYGLSKELTARAFAYFCARAGMHLGKFVISNPFGPFEEPRFTAYLMRTWAAGDTAEVRTPDYVRDNIHVDLLAAAYAGFVGGLPARAGTSRLNPSGYIESQGRFAQRFADAMSVRLGLACRLAFGEQTEFAEPRVRVNTEPAAGLVPGWSEAGAWDRIAEYYRPSMNQPRAGNA